MSKIALNLKEFKHLKSDDKSTTLQHRDGHILTLAHKSLSPDSQKQLGALSKVGSQDRTDDQAAEQRRNYDEGGKVTPKPTGTPASKPADNPEQYDQTLSNGWKNIKASFGYAKGGELEAPNTSMTVPQSARDDYQAVTSGKDAAETERYGQPLTKEIPEGSPVVKRGERMKLAEGGDPVAGNLEQEQSTFTPEAVKELPAQPAPTAEQLEKRKIYNQLVQPVGPSLFGLGDQPVESDTDPNQFHGDMPPAKINPATAQAAEQQYSQDQSEHAAQAAQAQQQAIQENASRTSLGLAPIPVPNVPQEPQPPGAELNQQPSTPDVLPPQPPVKTQDPTQGYADLLKRGFNNQIGAEKGIAEQQGKLGESQAAQYQNALKAQDQVRSTYQQHFDALDKERQAVTDDIRQGYVDPEKYWKGDANGNGGHSKIASGIGMILAGFNPTNNPNAALNFLKFQMEQNLNAQSRNLGAKENILTNTMHQFQNVKDAADFHRVVNNEMLMNQLGVAAANARGPMAKMEAQKNIGLLQREQAPLMMNLAMNQTMMRLANQANAGGNQGGNPTAAIEQALPMMRQYAPEKAKEWESRLIPGVGVSNIPVTPEVQKQVEGHQKFDAALADLQNFVKTHSTGPLSAVPFAPGHEDYVRGQQKAMALQADIRENRLGTVYREGEKPLLDKFLNTNPAGLMKNTETIPQLNELRNSNARDFNVLKSKLGIRGGQQQPQQEQQAPQFATKGGVKYQKVPGGWTPVK